MAKDGTPTKNATTIDKYALAMYVAMSDGKPDWNQLAIKLGSASANSLRVVWGNHKRAFLADNGQLDPNGASEGNIVPPKKAASRKRKAEATDADNLDSSPSVAAKAKRAKKIASKEDMKTTTDGGTKEDATL